MKNWLLFICLLATLQLAISSPAKLTDSFVFRILDDDFPSPMNYDSVVKDSFDYDLVVEEVPHVDSSERHFGGYVGGLVSVHPAGERFGIRSGLGIANVNPAGRGFVQDFPSPIDYYYGLRDSFDYRSGLGIANVNPAGRGFEQVSLPEPEPRPVDCCDIKRNSHRQLKSGKYTIYPPTAENNAVEVYCDMVTEGGGWTVFLLRNTTKLPKNQVDFFRDWIQYRDGFGTPDEEYWLGNENLHALTQSRQNVLRLEYSGRPVSNSESESVWGEWFTFSVASNAEKYKLTVMDPNLENTASNEIIDYHNGMLFTTYDEDNDSYTNRNCADLCKGGWWYSNCYKINPTGRHFYIDNTGIRVDTWSKEIPIPGYAHRLQLKMRLPVCGN